MNELKKYRGYIVEVTGCERFVLKHHIKDQNQIECSIQQDSATGDIRWTGLPPELMKQMGNFHKEDIAKYTATMMMMILAKINRPT